MTKLSWQEIAQRRWTNIRTDRKSEIFGPLLTLVESILLGNLKTRNFVMDGQKIRTEFEKQKPGLLEEVAATSRNRKGKLYRVHKKAFKKWVVRNANKFATRTDC